MIRGTRFCLLVAGMAAMVLLNVHAVQAECTPVPGHPCDNSGLSANKIAVLMKADLVDDKEEERRVWNKIHRHKCTDPKGSNYDVAYCEADTNPKNDRPDWKDNEIRVLHQIVQDGGKFNTSQMLHCYWALHNKNYCEAHATSTAIEYLDKRGLSWH